MADVCVIIGAGHGVSMGVARRFGAAGFEVGLVARNADKLAALVAELPGKASGFPADVGDAPSLRGAMTSIVDQMGAPSVLVYNVGVSTGGAPSTLDPEALVENLRVNVVGALVAVQAALLAMTGAGRKTILITGGGLALNPHQDYAALSVGKAGVRSLAFTLHDELKPRGIHVATVTIAGFVEPGTPFDPDNIAETYWALHNQPAGAWDREVVYTAAQGSA